MTQAPAPPEGHVNHLASLYTQNAGNRPAKKTFRAVPSAPERILDAPDLVDDYYLNLLDWSSTNVVSVRSRPVVHSGIGCSGLSIPQLIGARLPDPFEPVLTQLTSCMTYYCCCGLSLPEAMG